VAILLQIKAVLIILKFLLLVFVSISEVLYGQLMWLCFWFNRGHLKDCNKFILPFMWRISITRVICFKRQDYCEQ